MNKIISKVVAGAALMLTLGVASQAANAGVNWSIGINVPPVGVVAQAPGYYNAPVYVQPPPVYYAPPPPVYYQPRPIYYQQPAPVYYQPAPRFVAPPVYYSPRGHWHDGRFHR